MLVKEFFIICACFAVGFSAPVEDTATAKTELPVKDESSTPIEETTTTETSCDDETTEESVEITEKEHPTKYDFEKLIEEFGSTIILMQLKFFVKMGERINSTDFNRGVELLHESAALIYSNFDEENISEEIRNKIKSKQNPVIESFREILDEALDDFGKNKKSDINAEKFRKAAEELAEAVDEICLAEQERQASNSKEKE